MFKKRIVSTASMGVLMLLTGAVLSGCATPSGATPAPTLAPAVLPQDELTLTAMTVDGEAFPLEEGVTTTIQFGADGRYSGSAGCNRYNGSYTQDGSSLSPSMAAATRRICETGMDQETKFLAALAKITTFGVASDWLTLSSADGKTTLTFAAGFQTNSLTGVVWQWTGSLDSSGKETPVADPAKYTIQFSSDGTTAFLADCNRGRGTYELDGTSLTIGPGATTLMACPEGSQDRAFLDGLSNVSSFLFEGDDLVLEWKADGGSMRFTK